MSFFSPWCSDVINFTWLIYGISLTCECFPRINKISLELGMSFWNDVYMLKSFFVHEIGFKQNEIEPH